MNFLKVKILNIIDFIRNIFFYYRNIKFMKLDIALLMSYFWKSPYRIAREEAKRLKMSSLEPYGETPLVTMARIAKEANISSKDMVYELGSGRGRTAFWLSFFCGCKVIGMDAIDLFIDRAKQLATCFGVKRVLFVRGDFLKASFPEATVLYLFGSQLQDEEIVQFITNIRRQKLQVNVITISYCLGDYVENKESCYEFIKEFEVAFPWGKTTCYIQRFNGS